MKIRKATKRDFPELVELSYQLFLETNEKHGGQFDISKDFHKLEIKEFEKETRKRKAVFFLAEKDNEIIGMIYGQIQKLESFMFKERYRGHVGILYVKPGYRSKGIGTALFRELKKWFKKRGIKFLDISMMVKNTGAKKLYRQLGFKPTIEIWWMR